MTVASLLEPLNAKTRLEEGSYMMRRILPGGRGSQDLQSIHVKDRHVVYRGRR